MAGVKDGYFPGDYFLGVDAGNSKTIALVARSDGHILGWGRGGGGDIYVSETGALRAVDDAVGGALGRAGLEPSHLTASCLSLVGADWPEDFAFWGRAAAARGYGQVQVVNDAVGALRAGTAGDGVAVVCGTGAAVGARRGDRVWHSSFWQEPVGGLELSERVLRAVLRAELGLGPATCLTVKVLAYFGCADVEAVLHHLTARSVQAAGRRNNLSRLLLDAAAEGDAVALGEVAQAGVTLGDYAGVAAVKVGLGDAPFPLVLAGGVLRHPSLVLQNAIVARVQAKLPHAQPQVARFEPVVGALLLALEAAPGQVQPTIYERLATELPQADFFAT